jgi:hypothetical protein
MLKGWLAETFAAALQKAVDLLHRQVYAWCALPDG